MSIIPQIQKECKSLGITRLCHFTPSRNLAHIIAGHTGILATSHLETCERQVFNPTDLDRLDGHKGHICCSIEYPNGWYFSKKRAAEQLFKDWVVLMIKPDHLWESETLFCQRNASAGFGRHICNGIEGFHLLYQKCVIGAGNKTFKRSTMHLAACPTDNQAEVLIPDLIKIMDITGIVVQTQEQARNELCRLRLQGLHVNSKFYVCAVFYDKLALSRAINCGHRPEEELFNDGGLHG